MSNKKKYIIISFIIAGLMAAFFFMGTILHNPGKDFEEKQSGNIAQTGQDITLAVIDVRPEEVMKTIDIFGEIDQEAVVINAAMASTVATMRENGVKLKRGAAVINLINGVSVPMPFDGTVSEIFIERGQNVNIGEKLFVAVPSSSKKTKIKLDLPIASTTLVRQGMDVIILHNNEKFTGVVSSVGVYSDKESGSVNVTAIMEKNMIPHNTVVQVMIEIAKYTGYFVPKTAVILVEGIPSVKVVDANNIVETIAVETIKENDEGFYIISSVLSGNAKIVSINPSYAATGKKYNVSIN